MRDGAVAWNQPSRHGEASHGTCYVLRQYFSRPLIMLATQELRPKPKDGDVLLVAAFFFIFIAAGWGQPCVHVAFFI